jgi:hypothetical protein
MSEGKRRGFEVEKTELDITATRRDKDGEGK